jgi:mevalonate pyrophosphate decarboxylase
MTSTIAATHTAPTNIAVIKYWGKRDVKTNTPINSRCAARGALCWAAAAVAAMATGSLGPAPRR